jgi:hypothetical protein
MQPAVREAWVSFPVRRLRLNTAIALLDEEATYTLFPSGLTAIACEPMIGPAPFSARTVVHPRRGEELSTRQPLRAASCVIAPSEPFGTRLRCEIGAAAPSAPEATTAATTRPTARTDQILVNTFLELPTIYRRTHRKTQPTCRPHRPATFA